MLYGVQRCRRLWLSWTALLCATLVSACDADDRVLGDDFAEFDVPPDLGGDGGIGTPNNCDMTGTWIAELITYNSALGATAEAHNWFYYEIQDNGDDIVVTRGWDCGFEVCNATNAFLLDEAVRALAQRNRQDGLIDAVNDVSVAPRTGVFRRLSDGRCEFSMERWWWVRGADLDEYLPERAAFESATIASVSNSSPLPTKENTTGQEDWDGDERPGIYLDITFPTLGSRDVVQRDWNSYGPLTVEDGAVEFTAPAEFDNEESILAAEPSLLDQNSTPKPDGHQIRFRRISDAAPTDLDAFVQFCRNTVEEAFRPGDECTITPPFGETPDPEQSEE